jgi:hypothetical protein
MVSETSRDAYRHGRETGSHTQDRNAILELFKEAGSKGLTQDDVEMLLASGTRSKGQRVNELEEAGQISKIGQRRKTRSGRMAEIYVMTGVEPEPVRVFGHVWKGGRWQKG